MKLGVQMYSLREYVKTRGIEKMLEDIKDCGFDCIEPICDDYGIGYGKVGDLMRRNGLKALSMHVGYPAVLDLNTLGELKDAFGIETAVIPWMETEVFFDENKNKEIFSKALENANALGLKLAYHNHNFEFERSGVLEALPDRFPGLKLQPDIFWLKAAGLDPVKFVHDNMKNIALLHIKEFGDAIDAPEPIVGEGSTGAKEVLRYAQAYGCPLAVLEYEKPNCDDITYLKKSVEFMKETLK